MSNNQIIENTLYVTPCLQELKQGVTGKFRNVIDTEPEQQAGIWNEELGKITTYKDNNITKYNDTSDYFDDLWHGDTTITNEELNLVTKNDLLTIQSWKDYGFDNASRIQQGGDLFYSKMECNKLNRKNKWKMYFTFILSKMIDNNLNNINVFMVTHHNRMKDKNPFKGLIPFHKDNQKNPNKINSYANCFCLELKINGNKNTISTDIIDKGYPDKDKDLNTNVINSHESYTINYLKQNRNIIKNDKLEEDVEDEYYDPYSTDEEEYYDAEDNQDEESYGGGFIKKSKKYKYCGFQNKDDVKTIDTYDIQLALKELKDKLKGKNINVFIVRHGNSLHNKPLNIKNGEQLDSCLTPLGMFQAYTLGNKIKQYFNNPRNMNSHPILCLTSFLRRTQHTCLNIVYQINDKIFHLDKELLNRIITDIIDKHYQETLIQTKEQDTEIQQLQYQSIYENLKLIISNMTSFFNDNQIPNKNYDLWICSKYSDAGDCELHQLEKTKQQDTRYNKYIHIFNIIYVYWYQFYQNHTQDYILFRKNIDNFNIESNIRIDNYLQQNKKYISYNTLDVKYNYYKNELQTETLQDEFKKYLLSISSTESQIEIYNTSNIEPKTSMLEPKRYGLWNAFKGRRGGYKNEKSKNKNLKIQSKKNKKSKITNSNKKSKKIKKN